jgi:hypothetical protein
MSEAKRRAGTFVRIRLADGSFGYGRMIDDPYTAFYDYRTEAPTSDLETIASKAVRFCQAVRGESKWEAIGWKQLEGEVARPVVRFIQDLADLRRCTIFDSTGKERTVAPRECVGIERAAVWEAHQIEARLLDAFLGRPNESERRSRVRLADDL